MKWEQTINQMLNGETVNEPWEYLVKKANTEQRVSDLVAVLDFRFEQAKERLFNEVNNNPDIDILAVKKQLEELKRSYRTSRSEFDILYFTYQYFSEQENENDESNVIPAGVDISDAPHIHRELCHTLHLVSNVEKTMRVVQSMPRGHGKSLYLSNIFPLHQIIFRKRRFILIVSETETMSRKFIEFVSEALKFNNKLRADFGEFLSPNPKQNLKDNVEAFETFNGVFVQSASLGKQLRGARYKQFRPDLVISDDLESSKNTNTPELRQKNLDFFNKTLIPIGTPENTAFLYMGTCVHRRGLLQHVIERADFKAKNYSAIVREPSDSMELWDEFEEIYRNQDNTNRLEDAVAFYEANKEEMDADVETLWNDRFPYYKLMMEKVNIGNKAFASEFLNKPVDDEDAIFKESMFAWFDDKDLYDAHGRRINLEIYSFWDIAVGKNQKSDYNAIITIGKDRRTGIIYVLDAWGKKTAMHLAKEVAIQKIAEFQPHTFGVESVSSQYEMFRQLQGDVTKHGLYHTRIKPITPRGKKEHRIGQLEPLFENGAIRIKKHQRLLIQQLIEFQNGAEHDDMPDALASVVDMAGGNRRRRTYLSKPAGL
ncbi:phage terminase large subunit [Priestia megaterium]|uniref:phage terminase large subunit n=1 Tax=Priestia megaterium TaxID=1404 RepID=UPI0023DBD9C8|nr:phage terminase large subunit [Priestia megaterium]MDF2010206.1 phage terminase large subunit [Priestia megaterium]